MSSYNKTEWANNNNPPINADNLNKIEQGLKVLYDSLGEISQGYLSVQNDIIALQGMIESIPTTELLERISTLENRVESLGVVMQEIVIPNITNFTYWIQEFEKQIEDAKNEAFINTIVFGGG